MRNFLLLCLVLAGCSIAPAPSGDSVSLEGKWRFRIDSLDRGIGEGWYLHRLPGEVRLPASMAENGLGDEVSAQTRWTGSIWDSTYFRDPSYAKYREPGNIKIPFWLKPVKYYCGPAWYQKQVIIPGNWAGQTVFLSMERCHWESRVFINDKEAGSENSLSVPHRYDISSLLKKGRNRITLRIDNRMIIPVGQNSHSVSDHTQGNWNGIIGEIRLTREPQVRITGIQVYPDVRDRSARVRVGLENRTGSPFEGILALEAESFNTDTVHRPPLVERAVTIDGDARVMEVVYPMGGEARLWSEFTPALYRLKAGLSDRQGKEADLAETEFGMREFSAKGKRFTVNGQPVFLRGTLECCIFPLTGHPPCDDASWTRILARCREHGLNHIRFHSWCPPEAAFRAADRLGFYLQVECGSWANQGASIGDGGPLDQWIYEEGDRILEEYGNHPSFCMLAYGNEPAGRNHAEFLGKLVEYWKSKDPRRVYTSAAGWPLIPENDYHNGPEPRIQQWGAGLNSVINASPPRTDFDFRDVTGHYEIPFVSHEIGQWCVYPDFNEIEAYTGVMRATNFEIFRDLLNEHHMGHQSGDFLMASGKLQSLCYKAEIEAALRTPGLAGFQLLQLHDFPGQGTALVGVLNAFFQYKGYISPEEFRAFCNRTVVLARMEKRIFTTGEVFRAGIELSHFGEAPLRDREIRCRILDGEQIVLFDTVLQMEDIPLDNAIQAGAVHFGLEGITGAQKLTLVAGLEGTDYSNHWDFWVYPLEVVPEKGEVLVTDHLGPEAEARLENGGAVLLLTCGKVKDEYGGSVKIGFSSIFWNTAWTGGQAPHTLGILCDPQHPVFREFPTEYHSNWQWWDPVSHCQAMILDHLPGNLSPLIQPIHTWFENRKLGLLFEARVGGGKLMVCSIDFSSELESRPVSRQLLKSLLYYMNSADFEPQTEVDLSRIREMITL